MMAAKDDGSWVWTCLARIWQQTSALSEEIEMLSGSLINEYISSDKDIGN
jgi:hypothetical protein